MRRHRWQHRLLALGRAHPLALPGVVALVGLLIAILVTVASGFPPAPVVHDEFSYLLSADTFAHGRLTNPTHPLWEHFETFHVIHTPSYSSKYPPGNGLLLALGQVIAGAPIVAVWLAYAVMAGAIVWCLQAIMPIRWALWGGLLAATWYAGAHVSWGYWTASYWGGAFTAVGSALLVGALLRMRAPAAGSLPRLAVCFATGLAILATTRPFEGLLVAILPLTVFIRVVWSEWRAPRRRRAVLTLAAFIAVIGSTFAGLGLHNVRVTGSAFRFPYAVHEQQYGSAPLLVGLPVPPAKTYRHQEIACFYELMSGGDLVQKPTIRGFVVDRIADMLPVMATLVPPIAFPLLVMLRTLWRQAIFRLAIGTLGLLTIGLLLTPWQAWPHYVAPFVAWHVLMLTEAARRLWRERSDGRPVGRVLVRFVFGCSVLFMMVTLLGRLSFRNNRTGLWQWERARMQAALQDSGGRHLVVVSYGPEHTPHAEWVYNASDIDASPVVWARSIPGFDERLYDYFADRQAWRLHIEDDRGPFLLERIEPDTLLAHRRSPESRQRAMPMYPARCADDDTTSTAVP